MKRLKPVCDLQSCFFCKQCLPDWLPAIDKNRINIKFRKGSSIFREGDPVKGIFFIYSGKVKVHQRWGREKELIVRFAKGGDILGYRGLGDEMVYPVAATALEDVVVCFVDTAFFEASLQVNHNLTYELMKFYANELHDAERRMRNLAHMEVKGRVAETLLMLANTFGRNEAGTIGINLTKQDLASYSGTTYESVSRVLTDMIRNKLINVSGKNIVMLSEQGLKDLTSAAG